VVFSFTLAGFFKKGTGDVQEEKEVAQVAIDEIQAGNVKDPT